jgi:hypothetical protein
MIKVERPVVAPASLTEKPTRGRHRGSTETEAIIAAYQSFLAKQPPPSKGFLFTFAAYKADDVKEALSTLFRGKCAYCESRYAVTQPMDVEHWRPKGGVEEVRPDGKIELQPGYPWLAATWTNLLPSCIDCNRPRVQTYQRPDGTQDQTRLGKANQFPVIGSRMPAPVPGASAYPTEDVPLLIDPTTEDPVLHLSFREDGLVLGRTDKGWESIRVYALNRAELVFERLGVALLIEQRLTTIEALAAIIAAIGSPAFDSDPNREDLSYDLQDLVAHEIDALLAMADPTRPFSAMARQLIDENAPIELTTAPAAVTWPMAIAEMLQRFVDHDRSRDHEIVASRLSGLGFSPRAAASRGATERSGTTYLHWSVQGSERRVTLYQNSAGLVSNGGPQRTFATRLAGAIASEGVRPRVRFTYKESSLEDVLVATTRFRAWADGSDA